MQKLIILEKSKVADLLIDNKKTDGLPVVRETTFRGLPINIEIDNGMIASGKDKDGIPWKVCYENPYGEIRGTLGRDGDPVDVYLGPCEDSDLVFIVHQVKKNGEPDEDKIMLGFMDIPSAMKCYFLHGPRWGFGSIDSMMFDTFVHGYLVATKEWFKSQRDSIHFILGEEKAA